MKSVRDQRGVRGSIKRRTGGEEKDQIPLFCPFPAPSLLSLPASHPEREHWNEVGCSKRDFFTAIQEILNALDYSQGA